MSITSYQAAYYIGLKTDWQITRQRLHNLLFIAQMAYAFDNNGESLISNEGFYADDTGPTLRKIDEHISCYGAKPYQNLFRRFEKKEIDSPEIKLLDQILDSFQYTPTYHLFKQTRGYAWSKYYQKGYLKYRISQKDITIQGIIVFGKRSELVLLNNAICDTANFTAENIELGILSDKTVNPYSMSEQEKQIVNTILEKYGSKNINEYLNFGESKFFFKGLAPASNSILLALSYMDVEHKINYMESLISS